MQISTSLLCNRRLGILFVALVTILPAITGQFASAQTSGWQAGRVIDDAVFANSKSLNATQIQLFLNSKVPSCDTTGSQPSEYGGGTRSQWAQAKYGQSTFTCLKDYSENGKSAAQIIFDAAQEYQINPQVLLVLLQKEQGLVTDTWPLNIQYRSATGYGCPDTAPCDSQYYGLTNQLRWAARMFRSIMDANPGWRTPYILGNNYIRYNPDASCGGSDVIIQNRATQALYNYTPYQPNSAALAASMGVTVNCGAYGNINFFRYFQSWFGNTLGPDQSSYLQSLKVYTDPGFSSPVPMVADTLIVQPNQNLYVRMQLLNNGRTPWDANTFLGTAGPSDRASAFYSSSWPGASRVARITSSNTTEVNNSSVVTFQLKAPATQKLYFEPFDIVQEGALWFNNIMTLKLQVSQPAADSRPIADYSILAGQQIDSNRPLITSDGYNYLRISPDGAAELYIDFVKAWNTPAKAGAGAYLAMQQDGNLVLYTASGTPIWDSGTGGNPGSNFYLQADGNLVVYRQNGTPSWHSSTSLNISHLLYSTSEFYSGGTMFKGQAVESYDRKYALHFQGDGNFVLYNKQTDKPIWDTGTAGKSASHVAMQQDGNLVMYNASGLALWSSKTSGKGASKLSVQGDGNLVIYNTTPTYSWASNTAR